MNAAINFSDNTTDSQSYHHQYSSFQPSEAEPLSLFAQTLRETDEEFYATFPQARAAKQAEVQAQLNHGYFGGGCYYQAPSVNTSTTASYPPCDSMRVEHPHLYYDYTGSQSAAIHPTRPSLPPQNFDLEHSIRPERPEPYQFYDPSSRPLESLADINTYSQVNQLPSPIQSQHYYPPPPPPPMPPCCNFEPLRMDPLATPVSALPAHVQTMPTAMEVHPSSQYHMVAEPTAHWSNQTEDMLPALPAPVVRYRAVQEPMVRVTSRNHPPPVRAHHAQHQSNYQAHVPSHHAWSSHRSMSPRPLMPLPVKRPAEKKPPLACLFCRGRKIACGPPIPGSKDKTCNQCQRRSLKCEYPLESRRGMRKKKTAVNINTNGPKVTLTKSEP